MDRERIYREIFEHSEIGVYQTLIEGGVIEANPAMARMFGYDTPADFTDLGDTTIDALVTSYSEAPNALSELHIHHLGGAMGRVAADATAFGTRDREYILNTVARTPGADNFDTVVQWARSACDRLGPDAASYVNGVILPVDGGFLAV